MDKNVYDFYMMYIIINNLMILMMYIIINNLMILYDVYNNKQ